MEVSGPSREAEGSQMGIAALARWKLAQGVHPGPDHPNTRYSGFPYTVVIQEW